MCRTTSLEELATVASAISLTDTRGMWNPVEPVTGMVLNATSSLVSAKRHNQEVTVSYDNSPKKQKRHFPH